MRIRLLLFIPLISLTLGCRQEPANVQATSFYNTELFKDVQLSGIFEDSKTFVDLARDRSFTELEALYLAQRESEDFDLAAFVADHFKQPAAGPEGFHTDSTRSMFSHISAMWESLRRGPDPVDSLSSRIPLPYPYVVPGGRFREIYYWDSYFTMIGLVTDGQRELASDMVRNFGHLIDSIGFIPNGTRDYYLTRSQPPFFTMMVDLLAQGDSAVAMQYRDQVEKEYRYWMEGAGDLGEQEAANRVVREADMTFMNRYWDSGETPRPESYAEDLHLAADAASDSARTQLYAHLRSAAASGWDFSSRWYGQPGDFASTRTADILPVDLNCLLFFMEEWLAEAHRKSGETEAAELLEQRAAGRQDFINQRMWDDSLKYYTDFNFREDAATGQLTLAGVFPLYFGLADPGQASAVRDRLMADFLKPGGLLTTLEESGQQWDSPNGWAPLQWMAVRGLMRYGYYEEAREIMQRWLAINEKVYENTGKMMEKYNVSDTTLLSGGGEYPTQDGFGWTNGVAIGFRELLRNLPGE